MTPEQRGNPAKPVSNRASLLTNQATPTPSLPGPLGQGLFQNLGHRSLVVVSPSIFRNTGEKHQVQGILLTVGNPAEVIPEEKGGFAKGFGNPELNADPLIRKTAIHDREDGVTFLNVPVVSLAHTIGPARLGKIDLIIPFESFPDLQPAGLQENSPVPGGVFVAAVRKNRRDWPSKFSSSLLSSTRRLGLIVATYVN